MAQLVSVGWVMSFWDYASASMVSLQEEPGSKVRNTENGEIILFKVLFILTNEIMIRCLHQSR